MRKLTKTILPEVGVGDLKIRPRGDNRCESANSGTRLFGQSFYLSSTDAPYGHRQLHMYILPSFFQALNQWVQRIHVMVMDRLTVREPDAEKADR